MGQKKYVNNCWNFFKINDGHQTTEPRSSKIPTRLNTKHVCAHRDTHRHITFKQLKTEDKKKVLNEWEKNETLNTKEQR